MHALRLLSLAIAALHVAAAERTGDSLPTIFVPNRGQAHADVRFLAKGSRLNAYFSSRQARFQMPGAALVIEFIGATGPRRMEATGQTSGTANFLIGPEEAWRTGVPLLDGVAYRDLYPGIDVFYRGSGPHIKSEFIVAPGEDPARIRLRYGGADRLTGRKRWLAHDPRRTPRATRVYAGHLPGPGRRSGAGARRIRGQR